MPFVTVWWTPESETSFEAIPRTRRTITAEAGTKYKVIILALARCEHQIRKNWEDNNIKVPNTSSLKEVWSSSECDEKTKELPYTERQKRALFPEYRILAEAREKQQTDVRKRKT